MSAQIRKWIYKAETPLKAMILLGINGAVGPCDIARLEYSHINLKKKWLDYPRPKTSVEHEFPLWPQTVKALKEAIKMRPEGGNSDQVFCTVKGNSYFRDKTPDSPISKEFKDPLIECNMYVKGVGFYALRHSFETIASEVSRDQPAIDRIMGHADPSMSAVYRQDLSKDRLMAVVDGVKETVFKKTKA